MRTFLLAETCSNKCEGSSNLADHSLHYVNQGAIALTVGSFLRKTILNDFTKINMKHLSVLAEFKLKTPNYVGLELHIRISEYYGGREGPSPQSSKILNTKLRSSDDAMRRLRSFTVGVLDSCVDGPSQPPYFTLGHVVVGTISWCDHTYSRRCACLAVGVLVRGAD